MTLGEKKGKQMNNIAEHQAKRAATRKLAAERDKLSWSRGIAWAIIFSAPLLLGALLPPTPLTNRYADAIACALFAFCMVIVLWGDERKHSGLF